MESFSDNWWFEFFDKNPVPALFREVAPRRLLAKLKIN
jgi:hypothetical protein